MKGTSPHWLAAWFLAVGLLIPGHAANAKPEPSRVTAVIFLKHMPATRAVAVYERVLGRIHGTLVSPGRDNRSVTVRDAPRRVKRFRTLLSKLDLPGEQLRVFVRPVLHRSPRDLAQLITDVLNARKSKTPVTLVADAASRQLVVCTTRRVYFHIIDPLARKLDRKAPRDHTARPLSPPRKDLETAAP